MAKEIQLTQGKVAIVDDDDYLELSKHKWRYVTSGYATRTAPVSEGRKNISMHKFILGLHEDRSIVVDHINRNKLDNRKENLRPCSQKQNQMNRASNKGSSSQYKGVSARSGKFIMQLYEDGKKIFDKTFSNELACANYYNHKARELHGEFALLNDVPFMSLEECESYICKKSKNKYVGVSFIKSRNKWQASIRTKDGCIHVGYFHDEDIAAIKRNEKLKELGLDKRIQTIQEENE